MIHKDAKILIVEDERTTLLFLKKILKDSGYQTIDGVISGEEALEHVEKNKPDIILMDITLPGKIDGIEAAKIIITEYDIPVIFTTANSDKKTLNRAKKVSAYGFLIKPYNEHEIRASIEISLHKHQTDSKLNKNLIRVELIMNETIRALAKVVMERDPYTAGHEIRTSQIADAIALKMGLEDSVRAGLYIASLLHDIGKISVPSDILVKPIRLSKHEFALVQEHPEKGYHILKDIDFNRPIAEMVYQHHERLDGSGYPRGLKGDDILPESRIIAVADTLEAMTSHRPYRPAPGVNAALAALQHESGTKYDSHVVKACAEVIKSGILDLDHPHFIDSGTVPSVDKPGIISLI